jgi:hypothetical protein
MVIIIHILFFSSPFFRFKHISSVIIFQYTNENQNISSIIFLMVIIIHIVFFNSPFFRFKHISSVIIDIHFQKHYCRKIILKGNKDLLYQSIAFFI